MASRLAVAHNGKAAEEFAGAKWRASAEQVDDVAVTRPGEDGPMERQTDALGMLVIKVWHEGGPNGLRVTLTGRDDVDGADTAMETAASVDAAASKIRAWLERVARPVDHE